MDETPSGVFDITINIMKAVKITPDKLREEPISEYKYKVWSADISRMVAKYFDVQFYKVEKDEGAYGWDRYYVEYTLPEGLRLLGRFSYGGAITNGGFYQLHKFQRTADGRGLDDVLELVNDGKEDEAKDLMLEIEKSDVFELTLTTFRNEHGEECLMGTSKEARAHMAERSKRWGCVYTKGF